MEQVGGTVPLPPYAPNHRLQATGNSLRSYVASAAPRA
jgi:hypothetical protein